MKGDEKYASAEVEKMLRLRNTKTVLGRAHYKSVCAHFLASRPIHPFLMTTPYLVHLPTALM